MATQTQVIEAVSKISDILLTLGVSDQAKAIAMVCTLYDQKPVREVPRVKAPAPSTKQPKPSVPVHKDPEHVKLQRQQKDLLKQLKEKKASLQVDQLPSNDELVQTYQSVVAKLNLLRHLPENTQASNSMEKEPKANSRSGPSDSTKSRSAPSSKSSAPQ